MPQKISRTVRAAYVRYPGYLPALGQAVLTQGAAHTAGKLRERVRFILSRPRAATQGVRSIALPVEHRTSAMVFDNGLRRLRPEATLKAPRRDLA